MAAHGNPGKGCLAWPRERAGRGLADSEAWPLGPAAGAGGQRGVRDGGRPEEQRVWGLDESLWPPAEFTREAIGVGAGGGPEDSQPRSIHTGQPSARWCGRCPASAPSTSGSETLNSHRPDTECCCGGKVRKGCSTLPSPFSPHGDLPRAVRRHHTSLPQHRGLHPAAGPGGHPSAMPGWQEGHTEALASGGRSGETPAPWALAGLQGALP